MNDTKYPKEVKKNKIIIRYRRVSEFQAPTWCPTLPLVSLCLLLLKPAKPTPRPR